MFISQFKSLTQKTSKMKFKNLNTETRKPEQNVWSSEAGEYSRTRDKIADYRLEHQRKLLGQRVCQNLTESSEVLLSVTVWLVASSFVDCFQICVYCWREGCIRSLKCLLLVDRASTKQRKLLTVAYDCTIHKWVSAASLNNPMNVFKNTITN